MNLTTDGMRPGDVRCDACGAVNALSSCYNVGNPCPRGVGGSGAGVGRCTGTLRSRDQIAAMMEAERAEDQAPAA